jgi:hypothetical protein
MGLGSSHMSSDLSSSACPSFLVSLICRATFLLLPTLKNSTSAAAIRTFRWIFLSSADRAPPRAAVELCLGRSVVALRAPIPRLQRAGRRTHLGYLWRALVLAAVLAADASRATRSAAVVGQHRRACSMNFARSNVCTMIINGPPTWRLSRHTRWRGLASTFPSLARRSDFRCACACGMRCSRGRPARATIPTPVESPCRARSWCAGSSWGTRRLIHVTVALVAGSIVDTTTWLHLGDADQRAAAVSADRGMPLNRHCRHRSIKLFLPSACERVAFTIHVGNPSLGKEGFYHFWRLRFNDWLS